MIRETSFEAPAVLHFSSRGAERFKRPNQRVAVGGIRYAGDSRGLRRHGRGNLRRCRHLCPECGVFLLGRRKISVTFRAFFRSEASYDGDAISTFGAYDWLGNITGSKTHISSLQSFNPKALGRRPKALGLRLHSDKCLEHLVPCFGSENDNENRRNKDEDRRIDECGFRGPRGSHNEGHDGGTQNGAETTASRAKTVS